MKKWIAFALALVLVLGMVPTTAQAASNPFRDVRRDHYFYDAVLWAVEEGIVQGITENTFAPYKTCTRAEMVMLLWRAAGQPDHSTTSSPFKDVRMNSWYADAVFWAVEAGITNGIGKDRFGPEEPCERGHAVTFLWRLYHCPEPNSTASFTDVPKKEYFYKPVLWAREMGITNGVTPDRFGPEEPCERAQIVTFLYRAEHPTQETEMFTVTFETYSGSKVEPQQVRKGECAIRPEDPTLKGYRLWGWYVDEWYTEEFQFDTPITADLTLYAMWLGENETPLG